MTKAELIKSLETFPDDMDVFMADRKTEFKYGLVNSVYVKVVDFMEDPNGKVMATDRVIVIDEE